MRFIILFGIGLLTFSCSSIDTDSSIDLGSGYRFINEYPQAIIYSTTKDSPSSGRNVVSPIVTDYDFNEQYIFAISREEPSIPTTNKALYGVKKYWIVDKLSDSISVSLVDSITYNSWKNDLGL